MRIHIYTNPSLSIAYLSVQLTVWAKPCLLFVVSYFHCISDPLYYTDRRESLVRCRWAHDLFARYSIAAASKMVFSDSLDSEDSFDDIDLACDVPNDLEEGYLALIRFSIFFSQLKCIHYNTFQTYFCALGTEASISARCIRLCPNQCGIGMSVELQLPCTNPPETWGDTSQL